MSIPLLPEFDADGRQEEPTTAKINDVIAAVNSALSEASLISALADTESDVATAVSALGGGSGVPAMLPTAAERYYDNSVTGPGAAGTLAMSQDTVYAGLIYIEEPGKAISSIGLRVTTFASGTIRLGVAAVDATPGAFIGLPGTRLLDAGTVNCGTNGRKIIALDPPVPVDPGFHWIVASGSPVGVTVEGFNMWTGHLGVDESSGDIYSGIAGYYFGSSSAIPSDLSGNERVVTAPRVYFQITNAA